jgi:hypothetical protein
MDTTKSGMAIAVSDELLTEAARFGWDTFFDRADYAEDAELPFGDAVDRGWTPLALPSLIDGVQVVSLQDLSPVFPDLSTAAHFYEGSVEGKDTLAISFRSVAEPTDQGRAAEFAFIGTALGAGPDGKPIYGWDYYQQAHAQAVASALQYASDPSNGIDQILITGHSLGGILAELTTKRLLLDHFPDLVDRTMTITFGQPGSTEDVSGANVFNVYHTDDLVARLSDLSPLFQTADAAREGVTLTVDRPEWVLPDYQAGDLDTVPKVLTALLVDPIDPFGPPRNLLEHGIETYIDTVAQLTQDERVVSGVAGALGEPFRWLQLTAEKGVVGTADADVLKGSVAGDLLFGREGDDRLHGYAGDDAVTAGDGNDAALGGTGRDRFLVGAGYDWVDGGKGKDTALFDGDRGEFAIKARHGVVSVESNDAGADVHTLLTRVEKFTFDDGSYRLHGNGLIQIGEGHDLQAAAAATDFLV